MDQYRWRRMLQNFQAVPVSVIIHHFQTVIIRLLLDMNSMTEGFFFY